MNRDFGVFVEDAGTLKYVGSFYDIDEAEKLARTQASGRCLVALVYNFKNLRQKKFYPVLANEQTGQA